MIPICQTRGIRRSRPPFNLNSEVERWSNLLSAGLESGLGSGSGSGYERRIQLRRSWDLPVQDAVEQGNSRPQSAPTFRQMNHQSAAGPPKNCSAGEDLSPEGSRLAIDRQTSRALELGQQVEQ